VPESHLLKKNTLRDEFRKISKDSGILADVKTISESADLMSDFFKH